MGSLVSSTIVTRGILAISTLIDDFSASNPIVWNYSGSSVSGGLLTIPQNGAGNNAYTKIRNKFTGSSIFANVDPGDAGTAATGAVLYFDVSPDTTPNHDTNSFGIRIYQGGIILQRMIAGAETQGSYNAYDPIAHAWLRLRDGGAGTGYMDGSPDGITWTQIGTGLAYSTLNLSNVGLWISTWRSSGADTVTIDNLNVPLSNRLFQPTNANPSTTMGVPTVTGGGAGNRLIQPTNANPATTIGTPLVAVTGEGNVYPNPGIWTDGNVTNLWQHLSDWTAYFPSPATWSTNVVAYTNPDGSGISEITTPYGPGFSMVCTDYCVSSWSSDCKTAMLQGPQAAASPDHAGIICQYDYYIKLPAQTLLTGSRGYFAGVPFELHSGTCATAATFLTTFGQPNYPTPQWMFREDHSQNGNSDTYYYGPAITYDDWHHVVYQIYWTTTTNGYVRVYFDGNLIENYSGQTFWAAWPSVYLQVGWYSYLGDGLTSRSQFGPVTRRQYASGLP